MNQIVQCPVCQQSNERNSTECVHCKTNIAQSQMIAELLERVERLEGTVAQLEGRREHTTQQERVETEILALDSAEIPQSKSDLQAQWRQLDREEQSPETQADTDSASRITASDFLSGEFWLDKAGIGLTILALALLFRLAIDRGWITPVVRVGIGFAISTLLMGSGFWMLEKRPKLCKVLLGGGLVAYYITGFAAFQLYELISYPIAFGYMLVVTGIGYALALHQDDALLALIAALGGFSTPFLLATESNDVVGLVIYTSVIVLTVGAIYFWRGWQLLLWAGIIGSLPAYMVATFEGGNSAEKLTIQACLLVGFALAWLVPTVRTVLHNRQPLRWKARTLGLANEATSGLFQRDIHLFTLLAPFGVVVSGAMLWGTINRQVGGAWVLALAAIFAAMAWWLTREESTLRDINLAAAILLLTVALLLIFEAEWQYVIILIEIVALQLAARQWQSTWFSIFVHTGTAIFAVALLFRIIDTDVPIEATLLDLAGILTLGLLAIGMVQLTEKRTYLLVAHLLLLYLLLAEFFELSNGQAIVSVSWGVTALAWLLWGIWRQQLFARQVALGTLFVIVGKLLLVDFVEVDAVFRILLFFGFGVLFLVLSYGLWRRPNAVT